MVFFFHVHPSDNDQHPKIIARVPDGVIMGPRLVLRQEAV